MNKDIMKQRVAFFASKGLWTMENNAVVVKDKERAYQTLEFFSNLIMPLIDTYLITLETIWLICGKNLVLKEKKLIKEIHVCLKRLYSLQVIGNLHSCLIEIIETAVQRFEQMGFIETRAYVTKKGNSTLFLQCPIDSKPQID